MAADLTAALHEWMSAGFSRLGEVHIQSTADQGYELRHVEDHTARELERFTRAEDARHLAAHDDAGHFRPLKTAPNLRHGWLLALPDTASLRRALDYFYPAMLGVLRDHHLGKLSPISLRETLARQSGMYAVTRKITDAQAQAMIGSVCPTRGGCLKTILWPLAPGNPLTSLPPEKFDATARPPVLPLLCHEACNLLVAKAREVVKAS